MMWGKYVWCIHSSTRHQQAQKMLGPKPVNRQIVALFSKYIESNWRKEIDFRGCFSLLFIAWSFLYIFEKHTSKIWTYHLNFAFVAMTLSLIRVGVYKMSVSLVLSLKPNWFQLTTRINFLLNLKLLWSLLLKNQTYIYIYSHRKRLTYHIIRKRILSKSSSEITSN